MTVLRSASWVCLFAVLMLADSTGSAVLAGQTVPKPIANAGPNQIVIGIKTPVQLDGSASSDPSGRPLTYHWTIVDAPAASVATLNGADTVRPTFVPDAKGRYRIRLIVDNGIRPGNADTVAVAVRNAPPVADAGPDRTAAVGQTLALDGSASHDPDGDSLTFQWTFTTRPRGSHAAFADPAVARPTFLVDKPGQYTARLVVRDGQTRAVDTVAIDVPNTAPVANAGPDQSAAVGARVTLDGSGSSDVDGDRLRYAWTLVSRPGGSAATLANSHSVSPSFGVDAAGQYVIELVVDDGTAASTPDTVVVNTGNSAPVANAGPDQTATLSQLVHLDGTASTDVDGDPLTFAWSFVSRPAGSTAVLTNPAAVNPTFVVDRHGSYQIQLIVNDGAQSSLPDVVEITVGNTAPVANAGPDQKIARGDRVTLDGSGSTDTDGDSLTYMWSLTAAPSGSLAALDDPSSVKPSFTADQSGTYVAQLIVSDGLVMSAADTVSVMTENVPPVARPGAAQTAIVGRLVLLDGTASSDADGDPLTFRWSFTVRPDGSVATLTGSTTAGPSFTPDVPGDFVVQLIVDDGVASSAPATVTISTTNTVPVADAGADQLGLPVGATAVLDGLGSSDADGQPLTYRWSLLLRPAGSNAVLDDPSSVTPHFLADVAGDYVAQLIVDDGVVDSAPDTVLIRTNRPLVAAAGPDQDVTAGATVQLDGGSSVDPNGEALTYAWSFTSTPPGSAASLVGAATSGPTFVADKPGTYEIQLTVTNTSGASASDSVIVTATAAVPMISVPASVTFPDTEIASTSAALVQVVNVGNARVNIADGSATGDFSVDVPSSTCLAGSVAEGDSCAIRVVFAPTAAGTRNGLLTITSDATGSPHTVSLSGVGTSTTPLPTVTIVASDPSAAEDGPNSGTFTVARSGSTTSPLTISFSVGGTATNGVDYTTIGATLVIAAGQTTAALVVTPLPDTLTEPDETVVVTLTSGSYTIGTPNAATVTIADSSADGGALTNGANRTGTIATAHEIDSWTLTATAGNSIIVGIGETGGNTAFVPWIRLFSPAGALLAQNWGALAAQISVTAPATGTYTVQVASADSGGTATGAYVLNSLVIPGAFVVSAGDEGGALTNGGNHPGAITIGDLDPWTLTATAGETIVVNIGETGPNSAFVPWIRVFGPTGALLVQNWGDLAAQVSVVAPATGIYTVVVSTADSGSDATGTYVLTALHVASGPYVVAGGDEGGALSNGGNHAGAMTLGDLDPWTLSAVAGETIVVNIGETGTNSAFVPWIRLYGPTGALLVQNWGDLAAQVSVVAPATGTYTVLVSTADSGSDATGAYVLTAVHMVGALTVSANDEGGALTNGGNHTGTISLGDLDPWTLTAAAGETIVVNIGETGQNSPFVPWIRVYGPTGALLVQNWGDLAAQVAVVAPAAGTYTVLVSTADSGSDATGSYVLTAVHMVGPLTVSNGDEGGALSNGGNHTGTISLGDLDPWTLTAAAGETIVVNIGETGQNSPFVPWIRVYGPTGALLVQNWGDLAAQVAVVAPAAGTYTVLVSTADSGSDATGTYILTALHMAGVPTVSAGDEGGAIGNGSSQSGAIALGDLDPWTFTAVAGQKIVASISETGTNSAFVPWIRVYGPTGALLVQNWGDLGADLSVVAPATGTYTVLVSTADSGNDATGTYQLTVTR
jgi:hypothetical protein